MYSLCAFLFLKEKKSKKKKKEKEKNCREKEMKKSVLFFLFYDAGFRLAIIHSRPSVKPCPVFALHP